MTTNLAPATSESIAVAARLIRAGEVVALPTETVYGLGANALDEEAVKKVFEAKGRPQDNPLIVHVSSLGQIKRLIDGTMPDFARQLAAEFWPGPLTMLMRRSSVVPDIVTAGLPTVGIRMPKHPAAHALIRAARVPIAAPSANSSGKPSPTTAQHVLEDMDGRIPMILDGGPCAVGLESTVLDVTRYPPVILRPGGITPEMVARVCGDVAVDRRALAELGEGEVPSSPGMKYKHYAPKGALTIVVGDAGPVARKIAELYDQADALAKQPVILALQQHEPLYGGRQVYRLGADAEQAAAEFFAALREMDARGVEVILAEGFDASGVGLALMNRMLRAAGFHIISAEEGP